MEEKRAEPLKLLSDIILTGQNGKRILVDAFRIAMVEEMDDGSRLTLAVPVSGSQYSSGDKEGVKVKVKESLEKIAELRAGLK